MKNFANDLLLFSAVLGLSVSSFLGMVSVASFSAEGQLIAQASGNSLSADALLAVSSKGAAHSNAGGNGGGNSASTPAATNSNNSSSPSSDSASSGASPKADKSKSVAATASIETAIMPAVNSSNAAKFVTGQILVKFKEGTSASTQGSILKANNASIKNTIPHIGVAITKVPAGAEQKVVVALSHNPNVEFAEVDGLVKPSAIPNDYPASSRDNWHLVTVGAQKGWDVTTGSASVVVAVLDSGIDMTHPDLAANIVPGYNFIANNTNTDADGICPHGTGVAGTVATVGNNATGTVNVSWSNKIMPLVIAGSTSGTCLGSWSAIASAYTYAADHGVRVINISYGGTQQSSTELNAANYAWNKGAVIIASAGNAALSGNAIQYPAGDPNVVGVGAMNEYGERDASSNYGTYVDMSAPGSYIYTTDVRSGARLGSSNEPYGYAHLSGTSFAAPMVAGLAALVLSVNPSLTNQQLVDLIEKNADDYGDAGYDTFYGWGVMNMWRTLYAAKGVTPPADTVAPTITYFSALQNGSSVNLALQATDDYSVARVDFYKDNALVGTDRSQPFSFASSVLGEANGAQHIYSAKAYDDASNVAVSSNSTVTLDTIAPVISATTPASGATIFGTAIFGATITDNMPNAYPQYSGPEYVTHCWFIDTISPSLNNCSYGTSMSDARTSTTSYALTWNTASVSDGLHAVILRAIDAVSNLMYATTTVTIKNTSSDTQAPSTSITSPATGATVSGTVNITAAASDNVAVASVELYEDGALVSTDTTTPYAWGWDTTLETNGSHTLMTKAYDAAGNVGTSASVAVTVSNQTQVNDTTPPSVAISSPANGTKIKGNGNVVVQTSASDTSGIASIIIKIDGAAMQTCSNVTACSYTWSGKSVTTGTHTITATATDNSSNHNSSTASVTITK